MEEKNWEAEEKEKFFYEKFAQKPLEWLKKHDKAEYLKALQAKEEHEKKQMQKKKNQGTEGEYRKVVEKLKKECEKNLESWERQLAKHEKRIKKDMDYSQEIGREMKQNFIKKEYQLKDWRIEAKISSEKSKQILMVADKNKKRRNISDK